MEKTELTVSMEPERLDALRYFLAAKNKRTPQKELQRALEELRRIDPIAAEKLHLRDEKRIIRALGVWQETGRTITQTLPRARMSCTAASASSTYFPTEKSSAGSAMSII